MPCIKNQESSPMNAPYHRLTTSLKEVCNAVAGKMECLFLDCNQIPDIFYRKQIHTLPTFLFNEWNRVTKHIPDELARITDLNSPVNLQGSCQYSSN